MRFWSAFAFLFAAAASVGANEYDVVVYGGTSGGITAAIQTKRMGKSVILIEPGKYLGGLTTGGLGATDIGNKQAIGGMSREFYHRIWKHYQNASSWTNEKPEDYAKNKHGQRNANENTMWTFEPHVADLVYAEMLKEADITAVFQKRLDLKSGVEKNGARIVAIRMESGETYRGKMFIDATYEGDLMAKAGVSYHVGREANKVYDETLNGVQVEHTVSHQFIKLVDPYVKPGDPSSGLLPGVHGQSPGVEFAGDHRVQAYNFRMCTTDVAAIRRDWPKPKNYDPMRYEILLRNFEAGDNRVPWNPVWMPNRKTDTNNNFAFSTDNIGMNYDYPDGDYATREKIWQEHIDYQQGLCWTLANSPRVPEKVRENFQRIGLAKDEFKDTENWPRQLYVREARRMISDYVMTESNCRRERIAEDSVGMGAYNMDSHNVQRYVTKEGHVRNEGDIQVRSRPYPISFQSIRPRTAECSNLLVPICLAASHISYGSIRMEPVFMVLGQSSATAAVHAIEQGVDIQSIDYGRLKAKLLEDKQVLDFETPEPPPSRALLPGKLQGIVVDDEQAEIKGFETRGTATGPWVLHGYRHDGNEGKGEQTARFVPNVPAAGSYEVRLAYSPGGNRTTKAPVTIRHAEGEKKVTVDQRKKPEIDEAFVSLGTYRFEAGKAGYVEITNSNTDGYVIIDAIQLIPTKQ